MNVPVRISEVTRYLESVAPASYQESYDNSGLITGDPSWTVRGILVTLDCTEAVVEEALAKGCNLIVAHHPIVFKGLKKLTGANYIERVVIRAIRSDVAIYAIHTNLDNVHTGVNRKICERIGLANLTILQPRRDTLSKLVTFIPPDHTDRVLDALYAAGAGQIGNYSNCGFTLSGTGTFTPTDQAQPAIGATGRKESVSEVRAEVIFPSYLQDRVMAALRSAHPYEEVAHYVTSLANDNQEVGAGMTGDLPQAMEPMAFLHGLKESLGVQVIRATAILDKPVKKVAVCGGSGSFLLKRAIQSGAQVFISADFKYHDFFDADGRIIVADIGHYESEVHTKELLVGVLMKKFPTFAIIFSKTVTNPISYI
jgi:dinuclear metal center YbgI/SA1388 family protein